MLCCHDRISGKNILRRKGLFWLTVLEVSVHVSCSIVSDAVARKESTFHGKGRQKGRWEGDGTSCTIKDTFPVVIVHLPLGSYHLLVMPSKYDFDVCALN